MDPGIYYSSHAKLPFIGAAGQQSLSAAAVLVIGAGGLGCPCLLHLAGLGIGRIGIADYDVVAISNLHRQPLYNAEDVGKEKVTLAARRLSAYNPLVKFTPHDVRVAESNIQSLVNQYDIIIDCTDNFYTRYLINDACVAENKPLVYGAIHQGEGQVSVFNYKGSATLRCLFPKDDEEGIPSCAEIGAYNICTGIVGSLMANEVCKICLNQGDVLADTLLCIDVLPGKTMRYHYSKNPSSIEKSRQRLLTNGNGHTISGDDFLSGLNEGKFLLIDVRETDEYAAFNIGGKNLPLDSLYALPKPPFENGEEVVICCSRGNRSRLAVNWFLRQGYQAVRSLEGGLENLKRTPAFQNAGSKLTS